VGHGPAVALEQRASQGCRIPVAQEEGCHPRAAYAEVARPQPRAVIAVQASQVHVPRCDEGHVVLVFQRINGPQRDRFGPAAAKAGMGNAYGHSPVTQVVPPGLLPRCHPTSSSVPSASGQCSKAASTCGDDAHSPGHGTSIPQAASQTDWPDCYI